MVKNNASVARHHEGLSVKNNTASRYTVLVHKVYTRSAAKKGADLPRKMYSLNASRYNCDLGPPKNFDIKIPQEL